MDFLYVPTNVKDALKNGGKFSDNEIDIHRTVVLGDERTLMFPQFYSLIIIWIRFHNRVIDELTRLHPLLPNDIRFYEARRFVVAAYQSVMYSEALPLIISSRAIAKYRLLSKTPSYNPEADPSVTAEFVAASARFLHTYIHNGYKINFSNGRSEVVLLRNLNEDAIGFTELNGVVSGLLDRPWNTNDIADEPSNYLFTATGDPGLDLRALDFQTERDFGIGTYCEALYYFNFTDGLCIDKFSDLDPFISETVNCKNKSLTQRIY